MYSVQFLLYKWWLQYYSLQSDCIRYDLYRTSYSLNCILNNQIVFVRFLSWKLHFELYSWQSDCIRYDLYRKNYNPNRTLYNQPVFVTISFSEWLEIVFVIGKSLISIPVKMIPDSRNNRFWGDMTTDLIFPI